MSTQILRVVMVVAMALVSMVTPLNNGLARTPPMGFLSWERFGCNTDCSSNPDECIGERMLMLQADAMVAEGYRDVGYEYITVDDCWPASERDKDGKLQPDPKRFPSGIKALARYMHSKGLKLGLYEDVGRHTCAGFPGTQDHYEEDAKTLAEWEVDMLKYDGCNTDEEHFEKYYPAMGKYLNATGRPILYSCEWAIYARAKGYKPDYEKIAETCNTFRVYGDIYDGHQNDMSVIRWYGDNEGNFSQVSGPGNFADGDMITLGNYGLSADGEKVQIGMWSMLSSPLLMSVNIRTIPPASKARLQNRRVLAINQDPLGKTARRVINAEDGKMGVWVKPVVPDGSFAVAVLNDYNYGYPRVFSFNLTQVGLTAKQGYNFTEIFEGTFLGNFQPLQNFSCTTNPPGIFMLKATPLKHKSVDVGESDGAVKREGAVKVDVIDRNKPNFMKKIDKWVKIDENFENVQLNGNGN